MNIYTLQTYERYCEGSNPERELMDNKHPAILLKDN